MVTSSPSATRFRTSGNVARASLTLNRLTYRSVRKRTDRRVVPRMPLVGGHNTSREHYLFDLAEAEREAVIQPHTVADDLYRGTGTLCTTGP